MPETSNPLEPSGFDLIFPIVFAVVALGIVAVFVTVIYRLVRDRKKIAAYYQAMLELPGRQAFGAAAPGGVPGDINGDGIPGN